MEKRLSFVANWFSRSSWREPGKLRDNNRWPVDLAASLDAHTLYDIGETDCRPQPCRSPIWHSNPYHLLIEAIMNRDTAGFDRRL